MINDGLIKHFREGDHNGGDSASEKRYHFKSVGVFMGSSIGDDPIYLQEAERLAELIGRDRMRMVYGGGSAGLMGKVSEAVLKFGGSLLGVLTHAFVEKNQGYIQRTHKNAKEVIVDGIEVRKWRMITESDAFFVLPGGLGTLDELLEAGVEQYQRPYQGKMTVSKPIIVLNINGIYDPMKEQLDQMVEHGFAKPIVKDLYHFVNSADEAYEYLKSLQGQKRLGLSKLANVNGDTEFAHSHPDLHPAPYYSNDA